MSIYNTEGISGNLWLRTLDGKIESSNNILSSVYLKYQTVNNTNLYYKDLSANQLTRFDMFYDTIFVETNLCYFFEKITIDPLDGTIQPYESSNNLFVRGAIPIDYWFDETNFVVYYVDIRSGEQQGKNNTQEAVFDFYLTFNKFDCKTSIITSLLKKHISIQLNGATTDLWGGDIANIEKPKICYNKDTKKYNISFIVRNKKNRIGLISIMIANKGEFYIESLNGLLPTPEFGTGASAPIITDFNTN
jgi:hypothetical protein